jgi:hypothetical protein
MLRMGKVIRVGIGLRVRNGVGSRFRATIDHVAGRLPENDSRPLRRNPIQLQNRKSKIPCPQPRQLPSFWR